QLSVNRPIYCAGSARELSLTADRTSLAASRPPAAVWPQSRPSPGVSPSRSSGSLRDCLLELRAERSRVPPAGLEPATLAIRRTGSIQLSYGGTPAITQPAAGRCCNTGRPFSLHT